MKSTHGAEVDGVTCSPPGAFALQGLGFGAASASSESFSSPVGSHGAASGQQLFCGAFLVVDVWKWWTSICTQYMPAGDATPNHNHIDLLSEQELDRWCNHTGDDNEHSRVTSIVVGGTFLYSLLDSDSRFPAVVALEVRGEVPSAPPEDCASSLPSSWCTLQTLTGWNDALYRICGRKLLRVPKLVIRLALNASMEEAPTTFHRNVAAFQPDTLTVYLSCTEWIEWHALEGFLVRFSNFLSLPQS
ncbi:hypothetical protein LXA43DRAFT_1069425 [Ganoderma leucocontextum]|nr:hypothetical protein LXA43DRAFT_1069425 [Ganoderma leucocontextum]